MSEHDPLCVLSGKSGKSDDATLYANRVGLLLLRDAIDTALAGGRGLVAVREGPNWNWLEIELSDHDDFDCGDEPCQCGCQDEFKQLGLQKG